MKNTFKRLTALLLALLLVTSQMVMPVLADEVGPDTPLPSGPEDSYSSTTTVVEEGNKVTETTQENWVTSEVTNTSPSGGEGGSGSEPAGGSEEQQPAGGNEDQQPAGGAEEKPEAPVDGTTSNQVVVKEGEQTTINTYEPGKVTTQVTGSEDITTTDTQKEVTTTPGEEMLGGQDGEKQGVEEKYELDNKELTGETEYKKENGTIQETSSEIDETEKKLTLVDTTKINVYTPPQTGVMLEMTQQSNTDTKTYFDIDYKAIVPGVGLKADGTPYQSGETVTIDGKQWTVSYEVGSTTVNDGNGDQTVNYIKRAIYTKVVDDPTITWGKSEWKPAVDENGNEIPASSSPTEQSKYLPVTPSYTIDEGAGCGDAGTSTSVTLPTITNYEPGTYTVDGEGNPLVDDQGRPVKRTVSKVMDEAGENVIGYEIKDEIVISGTFNTQDQHEASSSVSKIPPKKPTVNPPSTVDGLTTTETLLELKDGEGNIAAYRVVTQITDAVTGKVYYTENHDYFGGTATTQTASTVRADEGTRTITVTTVVKGTTQTQQGHFETEGKTDGQPLNMSSKEYALVYNGDQPYIMYRGELYEVQSTTVGQSQLNSWKPTVTGGWPYDNDLLKNGVSFDDIPVNPNATPGDGYAWAFSGQGLGSTVVIDTGVTAHYARQYVLKDANGKTVYAYCMDAGTGIQNSHKYDLDNVVDSGYTDETTAKKLQSIAMNGYWGTGSSKGSKAYLAQLLKSDSAAKGLYNVTDTEINNYLTDGICLAATQAALWRTANANDPNRVNTAAMDEDIFSSNWTTKNPTSAKEKDILNALYHALLNKAAADAASGSTANTPTELLDKDNFATQVSMTIKSQVTTVDDITAFQNAHKGEDENPSNYYSAADISKDLYNVDMSFVVDVKKSDLTGNLTVRIVDSQGNTIAKKQLATEDSNFFGVALAGGERTKYTFQNLILPNGAEVTLKLDGLQNIKEGAYLYSAAGGRGQSQTFIGVASGAQSVQLEVGMKFTVTDPGAKVEEYTGEWNRTENKEYLKTENAEKYTYGADVSTTVTVKTNVKGTRVTTKLLSQKVKEARDWNLYVEYLTDLTEGGGGGAGIANLDTGITIPDEAVPLAAAVKTGDISQMLAIVSLVCLGGAYLLIRKERA